jgi:hypothetical protein
MSSDTLEQLQRLDIALLTDVVRQDQRSPAFEILDWTVKPLSHAKIIDTTGGLFQFSGQGYGEGEPSSWSIMLKILNNPQEWGQDPRQWCYWKREMLVFSSGMLSKLPSAVGAPRCYGTIEHDTDAWIWMEHIDESTEGVWKLEHFQRAARQAGRFGAGFLNGAPLPYYPWLSDPFFRSTFAEGEWWPKAMNPESPETIWHSPIVQRSFAEPLRAQILHIWDEKNYFFDVLDRLPQVFCHNDFHRRNLLLHASADGQEELIAVDWAFCGIGGIGTDMGQLIANTTKFFNSNPAKVGELESVVLDGYVAGLRDGGWTGDPQLARTLGIFIVGCVMDGRYTTGLDSHHVR